MQVDKIDLSRIYVGGLSQGGMGVLDLISRYPETFTAALSICGAGNSSTVKRFAGKVSLWLFHGSIDEIVPTSFSREYNKKLLKAGADVQYSEYPGVSHNSWVNAFNEPSLLYWLFSKRKKVGE
jgi:predicted peptidase